MGCKPNDSLTFGKKSQYRVDIFKCYHSVPCIGYGFSECRKKLKTQYKDYKGSELGKLRKQGVEISQDVLIKLFVYLGDTSIDVFDQSMILSYPYVIVECTFLFDGDGIEDRCKRDGHIVWKQLQPIIIENPHTIFILIHFSLRYSQQQIIDFFEKEKRQKMINLQNVVVFACKHDEGNKNFNIQ